MRKKDYELIAGAITKLHALTRDDRRRVAVTLAYEFELWGYKFDRQKFLTACGIENEHAGMVYRSELGKWVPYKIKQ